MCYKLAPEPLAGAFMTAERGDVFVPAFESHGFAVPPADGPARMTIPGDEPDVVRPPAVDHVEPSDWMCMACDSMVLGFAWCVVTGSVIEPISLRNE